MSESTLREIKYLHERNVVLAEAELNPQNYSLLWDNVSPHGMSSPGKVSPDISCGDFSCGPGHGGCSLTHLQSCVWECISLLY